MADRNSREATVQNFLRSFFFESVVFNVMYPMITPCTISQRAEEESLVAEMHRKFIHDEAKESEKKKR